MSEPRGATAPTGADILRLLRGYPPVLGAMLLVDGVITLIMGGDSTVTLGEVVAYLLLPPLAMFLVTQTTGGRRPNAVTLGVAVAGAAVLFASLFLLGGVHLVTVPPWVLVLAGAVLLGVALFVMRLSAPAQEEQVVPPLLSPSERAGFGQDSEPGYSSAYDDQPPYPAADETAQGLPRVGSHSAGPSEPEWPPRREPIGAPWAGGSRPEPEPSWSSDPEPSWSSDPAPSWPAGSADRSSEPADRSFGSADRSAGPADREWPPAPAGAEWPPRRDPDPAPAPASEQRSWFDTEEPAQPAESSWSSGPPDSEWPPAERTYQSGRRFRDPDQ